MTTVVIVGFDMASWAVAEAKARFSAVLDRATVEGPQVIQRRRQRFVLLTEEQLKAQGTASALKSEKSAWDALRPASGELFEVDFPRPGSKPRVTKL